MVRVPHEAESKVRIPVQVINWGSDPTNASSYREWVKWDGKERKAERSIKPGTMHETGADAAGTSEKHREWSSGSPG